MTRLEKALKEERLAREELEQAKINLDKAEWRVHANQVEFSKIKRGDKNE